MKYAELNSQLQNFYTQFEKRKPLLNYWQTDAHGNLVRDAHGKSIKNSSYDPSKYQQEMASLGFSLGKSVSVSPLGFIFCVVLKDIGLNFTEEWNLYEEDKTENRQFYYDVFIHPLQLLIELDGKNYHNFPGKCKFCNRRNTEDAESMEKMKEQYEKERFAITSGCKIIRFLSDEVYTHNSMNPVPVLNTAAYPLIVSELLDLMGSQVMYASLKRKLIKALKEYSEDA